MKGPPRMLNEPERSTWSTVCSVLLVLIAVVFFLELWFANRYVSICISGSSMEETLHDGEWVYTRSDVSYSRYDIVTIDVRGMTDGQGRPAFGSADPVETIIKRVIGLEGDTVKCENGTLYLRIAGSDGYIEPIEPYAKGVCPDFSPVQVGEGEIFVLGDNRANSHDSTEEGCLEARRVVGVVTEWSLEHKNIVTAWENFRNKIRTAVQTLLFPEKTPKGD